MMTNYRDSSKVQPLRVVEPLNSIVQAVQLNHFELFEPLNQIKSAKRRRFGGI